MVKLLSLLLMLCLNASTSLANEDIEQVLQTSVWNKRVILLFNNEDNVIKSQLNLWGHVNFDEWDLIVIQIPIEDKAARKKYQVDYENTISLLIGKDGLEKWRSNHLVEFALLEKIIDRMPMRQQEKLQKQLNINNK